MLAQIAVAVPFPPCHQQKPSKYLADFGSASYFTQHAFIDHFAGSLSYCAPEVISNGR